MTESTNDVIHDLVGVLLSADLTAKEAAAIESVIEFLGYGFFNEDASREIDRLTLIIEQQSLIVDLQQRCIDDLEGPYDAV